MFHHVVRTALCIVALLTALPAAARATLELGEPFGDHMVLQRDVGAPVWGWSEPGDKVTVEFRGRTATATTGRDGAWRTTIRTGKAGGPFPFSVRAGDTSTTLDNVLVGEVWLASGQSNMAMTLELTLRLNKRLDELKAIDNPNLRLMQVERTVAFEPARRVRHSGWYVAKGDKPSTFSAVAYFFGQEMQERLGVPVGMIHSSWGGTPARSWTSEPGLRRLPPLREQLEELDRSTSKPEELVATYKTALADWNQGVLDADPGWKDGAWAKPDLDDSDWRVVTAPARIEDAGLPEFDGSVWFRRAFDLTAEQASATSTLCLGGVDDTDITWVNGVRVGATDEWGTPRRYALPDGVLKEGRNVAAVRVMDTGGVGGFTGEAKDMGLVATGSDASSTSVPLAGEWRMREGVNLASVPKRPVDPASPYRLAGLYNGMISPLVPYAIRGVIWYQGESDAPRAHLYRRVFPNMIRDWRDNWNRANSRQGPFPFLFVQLANFNEQTTQPREHTWAELREAQAMTLGVPATGMATAIDIGEADDIHPRDKMEVARRLALVARARVYGERGVEYSGPVYRKESMKLLDNAHVRLRFDHATGGLVARGDGGLKGFALAGADRTFHWADEATIKGNTVVLRSSAVPKPVAVRYAWDGNPEATLYNGAGLPAPPFRTDTWPGLTIGKK